MINVSMLIADFPGQEEIADELIFSLAKGNREALKIIYEKSINPLYAYVLSLTTNKYDTEDVLQETYVSIAENAASYHGGNKAMAWIFRIARNFTLMHFRKEKNKESIHEVEEAVDAKYSFSFVENADHRMLLESAMEILEEEERQILFLHAVAGWKNREIAEYLGKNLNTVLSKYQRSIKKLQEHLGKDE
ncbi:RNA polymerase sigma factor [uncultured Oribacterium sp.]|jgi:RNA polymerase sigma factor, sigma-70 family|uniref:RNA polymerase sigma factor n=1 Tax=uncultured Oribacterium sp. TaxID=462198 RepID=UPI002805C7EB|nr:RNA polymerase sigma factor [uncultured Oribacterium sp.]